MPPFLSGPDEGQVGSPEAGETGASLGKTELREAKSGFTSAAARAKLVQSPQP
jgi:hypothetical protein